MDTELQQAMFVCHIIVEIQNPSNLLCISFDHFTKAAISCLLTMLEIKDNIDFDVPVGIKEV